MTDNKNTTQSNSKNKPVHTARFGCAKVAVWQNKNGNHSVTLERIYKDQNDQWKSTSSFDRDDLPKLIKSIESAYEFCFTANEPTS